MTVLHGQWTGSCLFWLRDYSHYPFGHWCPIELWDLTMEFETDIRRTPKALFNVQEGRVVFFTLCEWCLANCSCPYNNKLQSFKVWDLPRCSRTRTVHIRKTLQNKTCFCFTYNVVTLIFFKIFFSTVDAQPPTYFHVFIVLWNLISGIACRSHSKFSVIFNKILIHPCLSISIQFVACVLFESDPVVSA